MKIVEMLKPPPNQGQQAMNNPLGSYERGVHVHVHLRVLPGWQMNVNVNMNAAAASRTAELTATP